MASHTLVVLPILLVVIQQINSILATFFGVNRMVELSVNGDCVINYVALLKGVLGSET